MCAPTLACWPCKTIGIAPLTSTVSDMSTPANSCHHSGGDAISSAIPVFWNTACTSGSNGSMMSKARHPWSYAYRRGRLSPSLW